MVSNTVTQQKCSWSETKFNWGFAIGQVGAMVKCGNHEVFHNEQVWVINCQSSAMWINKSFYELQEGLLKWKWLIELIVNISNAIAFHILSPPYHNIL